MKPVHRIPALTWLLLAATLMTPALNAAPPGACSRTAPQPDAPHPDAPPQTSQFAFLIGDFSVSLHGWQDDHWSPPRPLGARWNGRYGLNGMAIYDEWFDPGPDEPVGTWGVNVRTYDPKEQVWKMMWISLPDREVQDLRAEVRAGTLTMWQVYPQRPDWKAEFEITDPDHWARISYVRDPGGAWTKQYRLAASRIACEPGPGAIDP